MIIQIFAAEKKESQEGGKIASLAAFNISFQISGQAPNFFRYLVRQSCVCFCPVCR